VVTVAGPRSSCFSSVVLFSVRAFLHPFRTDWKMECLPHSRIPPLAPDFSPLVGFASAHLPFLHHIRWLVLFSLVDIPCPPPIVSKFHGLKSRVGRCLPFLPPPSSSLCRPGATITQPCLPLVLCTAVATSSLLWAF